MLYNNYSETNCMIIMHLGPKGGCITNILKQNPQYITGSSHASRNVFMQKKLVITAVPLATHKLASYPGSRPTKSLGTRLHTNILSGQGSQTQVVVGGKP